MCMFNYIINISSQERIIYESAQQIQRNIEIMPFKILRCVYSTPRLVDEKMGRKLLGPFKEKVTQIIQD